MNGLHSQSWLMNLRITIDSTRGRCSFGRIPGNFLKRRMRSTAFRAQKRESFERMTLGEIRRRPTLPGRFQPSTISVLRLNFCVRDGNRWIPQAIVTGNLLYKSLLLPPFLLPSVRPFTGLPTASFQDCPLWAFAPGVLTLCVFRTLTTAQVGVPLPSDQDFRSLL